MSVGSTVENKVPSSDYEDKMLKAFVQKPAEPSIEFWYKNAFSKFNVGGIDTLKWHWSWWAFFGGFLFLLYRKAYVPALALFVLQMVVVVIPVAPLILWILTGGFSTYFVYKTYQGTKNKIELMHSDENKRVELMYQLGGYNTWVLWVYGIFMSLVLLGLVAAVLIPAMTSQY